MQAQDLPVASGAYPGGQQGIHIYGPAGLPDSDLKNVAVKPAAPIAGLPTLAPDRPSRCDGTNPYRGSTLGALRRPWEQQVAWAAITQLDTGVCAEPSGTQDALAPWVEANGCFPQEIEAS